MRSGPTYFTADYAKLDDVRALAQQIAERVESIDVLMNNAGGTVDPKKRTADGHEPNFQINHLGGFLLTNLLRDKLVANGGALVLNTSSIGNLAGSVDLNDLDFERRRAIELRCYGTGKLQTSYSPGVSHNAGPTTESSRPQCIPARLQRISVGTRGLSDCCTARRSNDTAPSRRSRAQRR